MVDDEKSHDCREDTFEITEENFEKTVYRRIYCAKCGKLIEETILKRNE